MMNPDRVEDLTPGRELLFMLRKDVDNLQDLRDACPRNTEDYERLNGKASAVMVASLNAEIALKTANNPDAVFQAVLDRMIGELLEKERLVREGVADFGSGPDYLAGYVDGLNLVVEKTTRELQYI